MVETNLETSEESDEIEEEYIAFVPETLYGTCLLFPTSKMTPGIQTMINLFCVEGYKHHIFTDRKNENQIVEEDCIQIETKFGQAYITNGYKIIQIVPIDL